MNVVSLDIENFGPIEKAHIDLNNIGLMLIRGINKDDTSADSNGSGKSMIPDALCWCFFDKTARDLSGDDVVNRTNKKKCVVTAEIEDEGVIFKIVRGRKPGKLSLFADGKDITDGTKKLTQEKVLSVIGCSYEVFTASIYAGQDKMLDLPSMTDRQLKDLIEEAAGVNYFEAPYIEAKTRRDVCEQSIDLQNTNINTYKDQIAEIDKEITVYEMWDRDFEKNQASKIDGEMNKLKAVMSTKKTLDKMLNSFSPSITDQNLYQQVIDDLQAEAYKIDKYKQALKQVNAKCTATQISLSNNSNSVDRLQREIREIEAELKNGFAGHCSKCGQPYDAKHIADITNRTKDLLKTKQSNLALQQEKVDEDRAEYGSVTKQIIQIEKKINSMNDVKDTIHNMTSERQGYLNVMNNIDINNIAIDTCQTRIDELKNETNPYKDMLADLYKKKSAKQTQVKNLTSDVKKKYQEHSLLKDAVSVFSPKGIRGHILDNLTPYLNQQTNYYLSIFSDGNIRAVWSTLATKSDGELSEKINIAVTNSTGADCYKGLSGGERRKVKLSCMLALQDLVSNRATKPISLYIADEIDHALDDAGLERLMIILEEKARKQGTALVISHNDLDNWIRENITIVKENGISKVQNNV